MFNISDIFKKYKDDVSKSPSFKEQRPHESKSPEQGKGVDISSTFDQEAAATDTAGAAKVYGEVLAKVKSIYLPDLEYKPGFLSGITSSIEHLVDLLSRSNKELLKLCLADYPQIKDFIYYHVVNVCIISIELGLSLAYPRNRLIELGLVAFLHDIGVAKFFGIINKSGVLSREEYDLVCQHPKLGYELLSRISNKESIPEVVLESVLKEHERLDKSGYPSRLKAEQIPEYARIIGLADTYESITHQRPYRDKYTPLEAIKEISDSKHAYEGKMIKTLLDRIGIFPVGSLVKLNTKEIAVVISREADSPLRPVVKILYDSYGNDLKEPKEINLSRNPVIYIEECFTDLTKATQKNLSQESGT